LQVAGSMKCGFLLVNPCKSHVLVKSAVVASQFVFLSGSGLYVQLECVHCYCSSFAILNLLSLGQSHKLCQHAIEHKQI